MTAILSSRVETREDEEVIEELDKLVADPEVRKNTHIRSRSEAIRRGIGLIIKLMRESKRGYVDAVKGETL